MKAVTRKFVNLKDVAGNLRDIADCVESWKDEQLTAVVIVLRQSQRVQVHAYGSRASGLEVQGILTRAQHHVCGAVASFQDEEGKG